MINLYPFVVHLNENLLINIVSKIKKKKKNQNNGITKDNIEMNKSLISYYK